MLNFYISSFLTPIDFRPSCGTLEHSVSNIRPSKSHPNSIAAGRSHNAQLFAFNQQLSDISVFFFLFYLSHSSFFSFFYRYLLLFSVRQSILSSSIPKVRVKIDLMYTSNENLQCESKLFWASTSSIDRIESNESTMKSNIFN